MKKEDEETTNNDDVPFLRTKLNLHQKKPELPPPVNPTRKQQSTPNATMMGQIGASRYGTERTRHGGFLKVLDAAKMKSEDLVLLPKNMLRVWILSRLRLPIRGILSKITLDG